MAITRPWEPEDRRSVPVHVGGDLVTPHGTGITPGVDLLHPWLRVLEAQGVTVVCLTSRTLNRLAQVAFSGQTALGGGAARHA